MLKSRLSFDARAHDGHSPLSFISLKVLGQVARVAKEKTSRLIHLFTLGRPSEPDAGSSVTVRQSAFMLKRLTVNMSRWNSNAETFTPLASGVRLERIPSIGIGVHHPRTRATFQRLV